jgi:hypothetical protein
MLIWQTKSTASCWIRSKVFALERVGKPFQEEYSRVWLFPLRVFLSFSPLAELVGGTNDKKRKQVNLQQALGKKLFQSLFDQVQSAVQELYPAYRLYEQAKLLVSYPGCKPQMLHMDFDPDAQLPEHAPLVVFVCVSEKANIGLKIGMPFRRRCFLAHA